MSITTADLAAASPMTYAELKAAYQAGELGRLLLVMKPRERVGVAAVLAERNGRTVSQNQDRLDALMAEAQAQLDARHAAQAATVDAAERDAVAEELAALAEMSGLPAYQRALDDVRAGATWRQVGGAIEVRRPGAEPHLVTPETCNCVARVRVCRHAALADAVRIVRRIRNEEPAAHARRAA